MKLLGRSKMPGSRVGVRRSPHAAQACQIPCAPTPKRIAKGIFVAMECAGATRIASREVRISCDADAPFGDDSIRAPHLPGKPFTGFGLHPHSGIATLTYVAEGNVSYEDTNGATGLLPAGGLEWMRAGAGVWHGGGASEPGRTRGFQLSIALPPEQELGPSESIYQAPEVIPAMGPRGSSSAATEPQQVRSKPRRRSTISPSS